MKVSLFDLRGWALGGLLFSGVAQGGSGRMRDKVEAIGPAASAADIPSLARLLDKAGWTPTPELSGVFKVGSVFQDDGFGHALMVRDCFSAPSGSDTYTSMELVTQLQAGVKVRSGAAMVRGEGELVKKVKFGAPVHHTLERLAMAPTPACQEMLARVQRTELEKMYAVQEVLTAEIAEQTCGRVDAEGRFVGLGEAEIELSRACMQESLEPVAVAYRIVPISELGVGGTILGPSTAAIHVLTTGADCPWGDEIKSVSSTMTTLTINGETFDVRGAVARAETMDAMQRCGRSEAALAFDAWRLRRRVTNITGATVVGFYPFGIGIVSALQANKQRVRMEALLLDPAAAP